MEIGDVLKKITITGPMITNDRRSGDSLRIILQQCHTTAITFTGKMTLRSPHISYPLRDDAQIKITPSRSVRRVQFKFCGEAIDQIVSNIGAQLDWEGIGEVLKPLIDYVGEHFEIVPLGSSKETT